MNDEIKAFIEQQLRDRKKGMIQVELLGMTLQESVETLQEICAPLAKELGLQIWVNFWPTSDVIWVIKWKSSTSDLKTVINS